MQAGKQQLTSTQPSATLVAKRVTPVASNVALSKRIQPRSQQQGRSRCRLYLHPATNHERGIRGSCSLHKSALTSKGYRVWEGRPGTDMSQNQLQCT